MYLHDDEWITRRSLRLTTQNGHSIPIVFAKVFVARLWIRYLNRTKPSFLTWPLDDYIVFPICRHFLFLCQFYYNIFVQF